MIKGEENTWFFLSCVFYLAFINNGDILVSTADSCLFLSQLNTHMGNHMSFIGTPQRFLLMLHIRSSIVISCHLSSFISCWNIYSCRLSPELDCHHGSCLLVQSYVMSLPVGRFCILHYWAWLWPCDFLCQWSVSGSDRWYFWAGPAHDFLLFLATAIMEACIKRSLCQLKPWSEDHVEQSPLKICIEHAIWE